MVEYLTFPQRRALGELLRATTGRTAKSIFTRSDVLWRLEERGLVTRNLHHEWRITPAGERAYEAAMARLGSDCPHGPCQHEDIEPVHAVDPPNGVQVHHYACVACGATVAPSRPDLRQPATSVVRLRHEPPGGVL